MKHIGRIVPNDGSRPADALIGLGPLVNVNLSPAPQLIDALSSRGQPVPTRTVKMMVDTGAQTTVVEDTIAAQLGLAPIRFVPMVGVSQKPELCPLYLMSIHMWMADNHSKSNVMFSAEVVGMSSPPEPQQYVGLLGRDFLRHFKLVYDGPGGVFEIIGQDPSAGKARVKARR